MVTAAGRLEPLKRSYQCYLDQTYPNRELVIVNEGPEEYQWEISKLVEGRPDVRKVFLNAKQREYTLGGLRNVAIACSHGELWTQWDDDDFNCPERIAVQYSYMARHPNCRVSFLGDQLHFYFDTNEMYWENWWWYQSGGLKKFGLIPGTIMAYQGLPYKYPSFGQFARAAEDSVLTNRVCDERSSEVEILSEFGYMQVYSFHGKNVWDVQHHQGISQYRSVYVDYLIKHRDRICRTLNYMKFPGEIKVMGRDGLAFTYKVDQ